MKSPTRARQLARFILITACLVLPTLSLLPLGGLYLWEKGLLLYWAIAALCVSGLIAAFEAWLLRPETGASEPAHEPGKAASAAWSAREVQAWRDVRAIARRVDVDRLNSTQAFVDLGLETIETVARRLHPEKPDPLWQFTLLEAMAITERVSRRLGGVVVTHVPFGDRLTLAQFRAAYRWRGTIELAERAYDVWRIVRLMNPATAVANEARERLSRAVLNWGREHVTRRIAESFVEEVGRAAIDLYGGRLRIPTALAAPATAVAPAPTAGEGPPVRVLVCGADITARIAMRDRLQELTRADPGFAGLRLWPELSVTAMASDVTDTASARRVAGEAVKVDVAVLIATRGTGVALRDSLLVDHIRTERAQPDGTALRVLVPIAVAPGGKLDAAAVADLAAYARNHLAPHVAVVAPKAATGADGKPAATAPELETGLWRAVRLVLAHRRRLARRTGTGVTSIIASGWQGVSATARVVRSLFRRSRSDEQAHP